MFYGITRGTLSQRLSHLARALGAQDALQLQNRRKRSSGELMCLSECDRGSCELQHGRTLLLEDLCVC